MHLPEKDKSSCFYLMSEDQLSSPRYVSPYIFNSESYNDNSKNIDLLDTSEERLALIENRKKYLEKYYNEGLRGEVLKEFEDENELEFYKITEQLINSYAIPEVGQIYSLQDDFNTAFQKTLQEIRSLNPNSRREQRINAYGSLLHVTQDFIYTVKTYGRIIISEAYLPDEQKTIKPISIGGIAGGDKYLVNNILFKFAVDSKKLYSGDEFAMKVAGHELKSWALLQTTWETGLSFPLISLVDYRGYRLIGETLLPISNQSLIAGSSNAGATVYDDPIAANLLNNLGKKFNLKRHEVAKDIYTCMPVDLEVHRGRDNNLYLLDFARLFPPEPPSSAIAKGFLYRLLRPELVISNPVPLCSDSFSNFAISNRKENNDEIRVAYDRLVNEVIPKFAKELMEIPLATRSIIKLTFEIHQAGINLRYMGLIRKCLQQMGDDYWSSLLLVEMISRIIKQAIRGLLRESMKKFKYPGEGIYRREVITYLNLLFGTSANSTSYWNEAIMSEAITKYQSVGVINAGNGLKEEIINCTLRNCHVDGRCEIIKKISTYLGIRFTTHTWQTVSTTNELFEYELPFDDTDLKEMKETLKFPNIISHSQGIVLKMKALNSKSGAEKNRLLTLAIQMFHSALELTTLNKVTLRNLADCYQVVEDPVSAQLYYQKAFAIDNNDTNTLYKYGTHMDKVGDSLKAENLVIRAIECSPSHSNALTFYADFLAYQVLNFDDAEKFYLISMKFDPFNIPTFNNYAIFLTLIRKNFNLAEKIFRKCVLLGQKTSSKLQLFNYSSFLNAIKQNPEKSELIFCLYANTESKNAKMSITKSVGSMTNIDCQENLDILLENMGYEGY